MLVIAPYYEDIACSQFIEELSLEISEIDQLIIIDDGSSSEILSPETFKKNGVTGKIIRLKRNLGHQAAISIGIRYAVENYDVDKIVILDSDGEDKPSNIKTAHKNWEDIKGKDLGKL